MGAEQLWKEIAKKEKAKAEDDKKQAERRAVAEDNEPRDYTTLWGAGLHFEDFRLHETHDIQGNRALLSSTIIFH